MKIRQEYRKVRKQYLQRVRYYRSRGYVIEPIPIPKYITRASIRRIQRETGEQIRKHAIGFQSFLSGEVVETETKAERRRIEKQNVEFLSLSPEEQQISYERQEITHISVDESGEILSPIGSYEQLIDNWYEQISTYRADIYRRVLSRTNELIDGKNKEVRRRFAYGLYQNPDVFPTAEDSTAEIIDMKMDMVLHIMDIADGSEAYYEFISMFDDVEDERE